MTNAFKDGIAVLGTSLASLAASGIIPSEYVLVCAGAGALSIIAILEKLWNENKTEIIDEIEDILEEETGLDLELDEVVETIVESGIDVLEDYATDGDLDTPINEVLEDLVEDAEELLKHLTVKVLKEKLKEHGLKTSGNKSELIERLLNA